MEKNNRLIADVEDMIIEDYQKGMRSLTNEEVKREVEDIANEMIRLYYQSIGDNGEVEDKKKTR